MALALCALAIISCKDDDDDSVIFNATDITVIPQTSALGEPYLGENMLLTAKVNADDEGAKYKWFQDGKEAEDITGPELRFMILDTWQTDLEVEITKGKAKKKIAKHVETDWGDGFARKFWTAENVMMNETAYCLAKYARMPDVYTEQAEYDDINLPSRELVSCLELHFRYPEESLCHRYLFTELEAWNLHSWGKQPNCPCLKK